MKIDAIVLGGGIVGLCTAYYYKLKFPDDVVALFEKAPFLGEGNTSRNSGVLHAGLYYKTGSKKHLFCKEGNSIWQEWSRELDMPVTICGKYVVATSETEIGPLEELFQQAKSNEIDGIDWADSGEISNYVHVKKCFLSKTTGYIDVPIALKKLELLLNSKDIPILLNSSLVDIKRKGDNFKVETERESFETRKIFNCTGFAGIETRSLLGLTGFENRYTKGNYLLLKKEFYNQSLIYPVPPKNLAGLGVHTTIDSGGVVRFGPNHEEVQAYNYKVNESALEDMWPAVNALFKNISKSDLSIDYAGIRTKLLKNGDEYSDFYIEESIPNFYEALGIESPGLTSAPAIGKHLVELSV